MKNTSLGQFENNNISPEVINSEVDRETIFGCTIWFELFILFNFHKHSRYIEVLTSRIYLNSRYN